MQFSYLDQKCRGQWEPQESQSLFGSMPTPKRDHHKPSEETSDTTGSPDTLTPHTVPTTLCLESQKNHHATQAQIPQSIVATETFQVDSKIYQGTIPEPCALAL